MAHEHVCPWWIGYLLANPLRKLGQDPAEIIAPYVREGMTVLEPGPGMGFFTLEMARRVGSYGRVIAIDIQPKMLESLNRRAKRAGFSDRIGTRLAQPDSMGLEDLSGNVDFVLAFAVVHEMPSAESFFAQAAKALKPGGTMLLAEPSGHVGAELWARELSDARNAGLQVVSEPLIRWSHAAVLQKT